MRDPTTTAFSVFSFLGVVATVIPLTWLSQAWNTGTCLYMFWLAIGCLNAFVNSVVWNGNALNPAPVWCDISSRIIVGISVAIPASSLCISRRLYKISTMHFVVLSTAQKRRALVEDLCIGLGIPVLEMVLQYIVEGHRFDILENIGCIPATYNVWPAYVLVYNWPVIIGLISAIYGVLTFRVCYRKRRQLEAILAGSPVPKRQYIRLMALVTLEVFFTTPLAIFFMCMNLSSIPLFPYIGWADTHFHYSRVDQIPAVVWRSNTKNAVGLEMSRWSLILCAIVFFGVFGFAKEARRSYKNAFWAVMKRFGIARPAAPALTPLQFNAGRKAPSKSNTTVVFVTQEMVSRRDSLMSMVSMNTLQRMTPVSFGYMERDVEASHGEPQKKIDWEAGTNMTAGDVSVHTVSTLDHTDRV